MSTIEKPPRKTAGYIDGYNLYYGRLRGTPFKWLDVVQLFQALLAQRDQNETLERVNLFTAHALATFATNGAASVEAQAAYLRALKTLHGERFETIYGTHSFDRNGALLPAFVAGQPYDRTNRTRVWKLEEKKTDVNLAIRMYRDACKGLYDRIILVSNDSDAEPALAAIRQDFPHIMIGVVMPIRPPEAGTLVATIHSARYRCKNTASPPVIHLLFCCWFASFSVALPRENGEPRNKWVSGGELGSPPVQTL